MRLLFDLIATQPDENGSKFHGGGEYAKTVLIEILKKGYGSRVECIFNSAKEIDDNIKELCKNNGIKLIDINKVENKIEFIGNAKYDVFYSALPYSDYSNINFRKTKFIYTIHGLRALEMPTDIYEIKYCKNLRDRLIFIYKNLLKNRYINIKKSEIENILKIENKELFVVSNHTKYSLLNFYPYLKENEIKVYYSPLKVKELNQEIEKNILKNIEQNSYFLLVSANRWIKNNYRAIKALDNLFSDGFLKDKKVLVLGVTNSKVYKVKNTDKFIFKAYVSEEELEVYYKNAFSFIYPTLNEGFGYPPVEAMKYETPVLASCISAVSEVCGDSVLYFNPYSVDEIKTRILNLYFDNNKYKELQIKGIERYNQLLKKQNDDLDKMIGDIFNEK